eukprot:5507554-Pleurochrysis_carterae.AAC.4
MASKKRDFASIPLPPPIDATYARCKMSSSCVSLRQRARYARDARPAATPRRTRRDDEARRQATRKQHSANAALGGRAARRACG